MLPINVAALLVAAAPRSNAQVFLIPPNYPDGVNGNWFPAIGEGSWMDAWWIMQNASWARTTVTLCQDINDNGGFCKPLLNTTLKPQGLQFQVSPANYGFDMSQSREFYLELCDGSADFCTDSQDFNVEANMPVSTASVVTRQCGRVFTSTPQYTVSAPSITTSIGMMTSSTTRPVVSSTMSTASSDTMQLCGTSPLATSGQTPSTFSTAPNAATLSAALEPSSSAGPSQTTSSLSVGAKAGVGVGVSVFSVAMVGVPAWYLLRQRRPKNEFSSPQDASPQEVKSTQGSTTPYGVKSPQEIKPTQSLTPLYEVEGGRTGS